MTDTTAVERAPRRTASLEPRSLDELAKLATTLAQAKMVPRGMNSVADIMAVALAGQQHGWGVMDSVMRFHLIEGTATMKPEAMLGLVRGAGHSVSIIPDEDGVTVTGRRGDNGDEMTTRFTLADAKRIGLAGKSNWKNYPTQMCQWRAVSALCKALFTDLLMGFYIPDEMGAETDEDGEPVTVDAEVVEPRQVTAPKQPANRKRTAAAPVDAEVVEPEEGVTVAAAKRAILNAVTDAYAAAPDLDPKADAKAFWVTYETFPGVPTDEAALDVMIAEAGKTATERVREHNAAALDLATEDATE